MNTRSLNPVASAMPPFMTDAVLRRQNRLFRGTAGVSARNRHRGFAPAFLDTATGTVYPARYADGRPAPIHLLEGLPPEVVVGRTATGQVAAVRESMIAGFVRGDRFYTREQAAAAVAN